MAAGCTCSKPQGKLGPKRAMAGKHAGTGLRSIFLPSSASLMHDEDCSGSRIIATWHDYPSQALNPHHKLACVRAPPADTAAAPSRHLSIRWAPSWDEFSALAADKVTGCEALALNGWAIPNCPPPPYQHSRLPRGNEFQCSGAEAEQSHGATPNAAAAEVSPGTRIAGCGRVTRSIGSPYMFA